MRRVASLLILATLVAPALVPVATAMTQAEFEDTLATMQEDVRLARERYAAGDADAALQAAERVVNQFATDASGTGPLEAKIKETSAVAIGDRVKALATRLASTIRAGASVEEVEAVADELEPNLNRLVLVAEGRVTPASGRTLRDEATIDAAVKEVDDLIDEAVDTYRAGDADEAAFIAYDAFITFEANGIGADTEVVDKALEDAAENLITQSYKARVETHPGLAQLMENGAPLDDVEAKADEIRQALEQIRELLKATLPPIDIGDANGDGRVNIVDALLTAQAALGLIQKTGEMDVNGDGAVTIVDALFIAQAALGIRRL